MGLQACGQLAGRDKTPATIVKQTHDNETQGRLKHPGEEDGEACNGTHEANGKLSVELLGRQGDTDSQTLESLAHVADKITYAAWYMPIPWCKIAPNNVKHGQPRLTAATCGSRLDTLSLANLHGGLVVDGGCSHTLLDLSCHCQESLFNIRCVLG